MANDVFANGREISCKKADGKAIAAFPDVCMTPPENPATPPGVPVPYPNTGMAKDTTAGSKSVKISGQEVMLRNKSHFKTSYGDEAGCAAKKGVVSSKIKGKVYFTSWSSNVKIEKKNAVRHFDRTTHNHGSPANENIPWPYADSQALPNDSKCKGDKKKKDKACEGDDPCPGVLKMKPGQLKRQMAKAPSQRSAAVKALDSTAKGKESRTSKAARAATKEANGSKCVKASRCQLKPYKPQKGQSGCCPGQTPHHIPPKTCFKGVKKYKADSALCVCLEGTSQHVGSHGKNHAAIDYLAGENGIKPGQKVSIADYNKICAQSVAAQCGCNAECIEQQLNESLKPTDRKIKHWDSSSNQLTADIKSKLDKMFKAVARKFSKR